MNSEPKQAEQVISLDIGSTFTKAGLFEVKSDHLTLLRSVRVPTTTDSLCRAVYQVIRELDCLDEKTQKPVCPIYFSSSAKGGLHVIAVGIVPTLTLNVAQMAALSAGAKVSRSFGYKLTPSDIQEIESLNPDIILLSGGTDGGNESYLLHNAQSLSSLTVRPQIIYAGNRALIDKVRLLLEKFPLHFTSNILPELDRPNVDDARQKICEVFLETIIDGKGLNEVIELLGRNPLPTPLAVMELVEAIRNHCGGWTDFGLIDLGGATTDIYSCTRENQIESNVVCRGLPEPEVKRTVEGDLGIRINADSVMIAGSKYLQESKSTEEILAMMDYVYKITQQAAYLPNNEQERLYDRTLAEICVIQGLKRHVGRRKRIYTECGQTFLQTGKDLRGVRKLILTGGFLSGKGITSALQGRLKGLNNCRNGMVYLLPREIEYYQDKEYLFPLLGNLVRAYPLQAGRTAVKCLISLRSNCHLATEATC